MTREPIKFFIINSFRTMVYVAYFATIAYGLMMGLANGGNITVEFGKVLFGMELELNGLTQALDVVICLLGGWIAASVVGGLIVTILDIRDDINDRLPDARQDI